MICHFSSLAPSTFQIGNLCPNTKSFSFPFLFFLLFFRFCWCISKARHFWFEFRSHENVQKEQEENLIEMKRFLIGIAWIICDKYVKRIHWNGHLKVFALACSVNDLKSLFEFWLNIYIYINLWPANKIQMKIMYKLFGSSTTNTYSYACNMHSCTYYATTHIHTHTLYLFVYMAVRHVINISNKHPNPFFLDQAILACEGITAGGADVILHLLYTNHSPGRKKMKHASDWRN